MFKRARWMTTGFVVGLGSSYAVARRARRLARRYTPPQLADRVAGTADSLRRDVHAAVHEGRAAMHDREADLRAEVGRRWQ
ncbi:MAG: hypothetical protein JWL83_425 [Actinomycetia bacterium]|jgi:hypothetical protein|nr:hypothetical protein [Actinomycetes bacterium]